MTEEEISGFIYGKHGVTVEFYELLSLVGRPKSVEVLTRLSADAEVIADCLVNSYSLEELISEGIIEEVEGDYVLVD